MPKVLKSESPFIKALRSKFQKGKYSILSQVEVPSGAGCRVVDAIVLGKWSSIDLSIQGFEIKATRSNWLQEIGNPEKSEAGFSYCDTWSLLTYPGVADPQEIPPKWGHLVLDGFNLEVLKEAPKLQALPVDRSFVARISDAILSQASRNVELLSSQEEYDRGFSEGKERGYREAAEAQGYIEHRLAQQALEIERMRADLRVTKLDRFSKEQINTIQQVASLVRSRGRADEALRTLELFISADQNKLKSQLENLYQDACHIKQAIEDRLYAVKSIEENSNPS